MINIVGPRGSGKTTKLFKAAKENNGIILTSNSRALREKAKSLGYRDLEIIGFGDLDNDNFSLGKNVFIDNIDSVCSNLLNKFYGLETAGFSITVNEDETRN